VSAIHPNKQTLIFIADDDLEDCEMLEEALRAVDGTVQTRVFTDGRQILTELLQAPDHELPQLLILDYNMPYLTGCEVLHEIAGEPRYNGITKYILSTSSNPQYMSECRDNGAEAYYVKPNTFEELTALVGRMLTSQWQG
jgi:CheY-like chemotaxis protein